MAANLPLGVHGTGAPPLKRSTKQALLGPEKGRRNSEEERFVTKRKQRSNAQGAILSRLQKPHAGFGVNLRFASRVYHGVGVKGHRKENHL